MLLGQGKEWNNKSFALPHNVPANEFYKLQGRKFNTSSGWYIDTEDFFEKYRADAARFYLLLSAPETADAEFTWEGFQNANNSLLADKLGNFASRVIKFNAKRFDGCVPESDGGLNDHPQLKAADASFAAIGERIRKYEFKAAAKELMGACDSLNQFFDAMAPWKLIKSEDAADQLACRNTLERCLAYLELLSRRMAPICPTSAGELRVMLGEAIAPASKAQRWGEESAEQSPASLASGLATGEAQVMFQKIDNDAIEAEVNRLESVVSD